MLSSRRKFVIGLAVLVSGLSAPAHAQQIVAIERGSPDRTAILDVVRASVEQRLGIKVVFVVTRLTTTGEWAFADLRPRTATGGRIDYRKTRYAMDFHPDLDSDTVDVLLKREGKSWKIVEEAFLPTDVVWEEWQEKHKLPRELFFVE